MLAEVGLAVTGMGWSRAVTSHGDAAPPAAGACGVRDVGLAPSSQRGALAFWKPWGAGGSSGAPAAPRSDLLCLLTPGWGQAGMKAPRTLRAEGLVGETPLNRREVAGGGRPCCGVWVRSRQAGAQRHSTGAASPLPGPQVLGISLGREREPAPRPRPRWEGPCLKVSSGPLCPRGCLGVFRILGSSFFSRDQGGAGSAAWQVGLAAPPPHQLCTVASGCLARGGLQGVQEQIGFSSSWLQV